MNHIPVRNCAVCRVKLPKRELVRIVRTPDGLVVYDPKHRIEGRGLYLCGQKDCLDKFQKKGLVKRFLKVSPPEELFRRLEEVIKEN